MTNSSISNFFKINTIIYSAFVIGQLLLLAVVYSIKLGTELVYNQNEILFIISCVLIVFSFGIGKFLFASLLKQAQNESALSLKLKKYNSAYIIKMALSEGANLFVIAAFFLTSNFYILIAAIIGIVIFLTHYSNKNKIINQLNLDYNEVELLNNPDYSI